MLLFFIFIVVKNIGAVDSSITPDQTIISSSEGSIITLTCTYDDSAYSLHWYQQKPHSEPEFLLLIHKSTDSVTKAAHDPRLSTRVHKKEKKVQSQDFDDYNPSGSRFNAETSTDSTVLTIKDLQISDTALYHCALRVVAQ
ncbi:hypothetical protein QTP70_020620 [Hemibagrus guttatus]|uniref:Ig-like domain-containing protein n=1 Tax=Hemibagrus guttatus TaxID=175788 RepID=A0AAE0PPF5_9TELE|nr:hypothetical protein QTP70_020620 [Hemibagrus guttatus]